MSVQCAGEGQKPVPDTSRVTNETTYRGRRIVTTVADCPVCYTPRVVRADGTIPMHRDSRSPKRRREDAARAAYLAGGGS